MFGALGATMLEPPPRHGAAAQFYNKCMASAGRHPTKTHMQLTQVCGAQARRYAVTHRSVSGLGAPDPTDLHIPVMGGGGLPLDQQLKQPAPYVVGAAIGLGLGYLVFRKKR